MIYNVAKVAPWLGWGAVLFTLTLWHLNIW